MIMDGHLANMVTTATTWIMPVIFAVTFHEAAHGFVALRFGDDTALRAGRVTLNPINHIDPFGTIVLPGMLLLIGSGFLFGYAKPVPVNFGRLRPLRVGMVLVALAGPATNILLAIISALLAYGLPYLPDSSVLWAKQNIEHSILLNVVLCVFNMLPLPPLDGGRVAVGLLPRPLAYPLARVEPYGMMILMGLILIGFVAAQVGVRFSPLGWLISGPAAVLYDAVLTVTGLS
jgi:Zn-dependent protease